MDRRRIQVARLRQRHGLLEPVARVLAEHVYGGMKR